MKKFFIASLLIVAILINTPIRPAQAWMGILDASIDPVVSAIDGVDSAANTGSFASDVGKEIKGTITASILAGIKIAALMTVQSATALIIGGPKGDQVIHDYNNYLYVSPQQIAMQQMDAFFNTVSRGRASTMNYEGVGPNYDAYLINQARLAIAGQSFSTNLQDQVTDPSQMFSAGNMKGITSYMQCANNVMCYTLVSTARYNQEFSKAQDLARSEAVNGFAPRKTNGRIVQPAALAQSALTQIDQLGTQIIMNAPTDKNADVSSSITQISAGASISLSARLANYYISDDSGKQAIKNKNSQFPFSLSYSSANGLGINAGGVTASTGVGAFGGQTQIGNTCATGGFLVDANGAAVLVNGQKKTCETTSSANVTGPSATVSAPSGTFNGNTVGGGTQTIQ